MTYQREMASEIFYLYKLIIRNTLHLLKPIKGKYIFLGGKEFVFHVCTYIGKSFHSSILFVLQGSELFVE
jgi:hypothetical protein